MQVDFSKMQSGGLDAGFFIVYVEQSSLTSDGYEKAKDLAMLKFNAIHKMVNTYPNKIRLALNPSDIKKAKEETSGKIAPASSSGSPGKKEPASGGASAGGGRWLWR